MVMGMINLTLYSPAVFGYMWFFQHKVALLFGPTVSTRKSFEERFSERLGRCELENILLGPRFLEGLLTAAYYGNFYEK